MASEQDYNDIIDQIDNLTGMQLDIVEEYLDNTVDSPGTVMKWIMRKLRDWAYPS